MIFLFRFQADFDDYNVILVKAIADRLAEAFAEELHERVRKDLWGYASDEYLEANDLHRIKYQASNGFLFSSFIFSSFFFLTFNLNSNIL